MTYTTSEQSVRAGQPVELFFLNSAANQWRQTSAAYDIDYLGNTYSKTGIQRENLAQTSEFAKQEIKLRMGRNNLLAASFIAGAPEDPISLTIYRGHGSNFVTFWIGQVTSGTFEADEFVITAAPRTRSLQRKGLRRRYQRQCNLPLYGMRCQVLRTSYNVTGSISTISGVTVTATEFGTKTNGWFVGGDLVVGTARRLIVAHSGTSITINRPIPSGAAGQSFTAYAGCDHSVATCKTKFSNLANYGGQPWIPTKNPFQGDALI